jgi:hypothetical protein
MKVTSDIEITELSLKDGKIIGKLTHTIPDYPVIPTTPPVVEPPIVTPPPTTKVINVSPGINTIGNAAKAAASGYTIVPANGTYNEADFILPPGVSIVGQSKDGVIVNATTKKIYPTDDPLKNGVIQARSDSRVNGNQRIANLTIRGNGNAIGGILVNNRDNVTVEDIYIENCNFYGLWLFYADNPKVYRVKTFNTSWCSTSFASGEICFAEISNYIFEDIEVTSNSPTRGYGFKFLWGNYTENGVTKYRNLYAGTFRRIKTRMNHSSNWANNTSYNIGFELHDFIAKGPILIESPDFGNQVSLHSPVADNFPITFRNPVGDLGNDRYVFEVIKDNVIVENPNFKNASQFMFNGQDNRLVTNVQVTGGSYDQGTAPNTGWGAFVLIGRKGTQGVVFKNMRIRKSVGNDLIKWQQDPKTGVSIDSTNPVTNF